MEACCVVLIFTACAKVKEIQCEWCYCKFYESGNLEKPITTYWLYFFKHMCSSITLSYHWWGFASYLSSSFSLYVNANDANQSYPLVIQLLYNFHYPHLEPWPARRLLRACLCQKHTIQSAPLFSLHVFLHQLIWWRGWVMSYNFFWILSWIFWHNWWILWCILWYVSWCD